MRRDLERFANRVLRRAGYELTLLGTFPSDNALDESAPFFPTPWTDADDVRALLGRLSPVSTARELVRLGPEGDGGYLVPDDLDGIEACFSPGVNEVSGFEKDCADLGMDVFLADKSVSQPAEAHERFHFTKRYVGALTNEDFMTMDGWVEASVPGSEGDLLLQIDIEGSEYETFLATSDGLMGRFRIVVAEFHALHHLWSRPFFEVASRAFDKVLQTHTCVHVHPNNCCGTLTRGGVTIPRVVEFTFLRTDRVRRPTPATAFPHPLDRDNTSYPHIALPDSWYRRP